MNPRPRHPRLVGFAALLLLLTLLVGLPAVLLSLGWGPVPSGLDGWWAALTTPDDGHLTLFILKVAAWLVWGILVVTILTEAVAALRGLQPPKLPGLRWSQVPARRLVAAALLLFISVPSAGLDASAAPTAPTPASTAPVASEPGAAAATISPATRTDAAASVVTHTVRRGETLWSIAEHHLGAGSRYPDIVKLNQSVLQGKPQFLRPGWVLRLPSTAAEAVESGEERDYTVVKGDTLSEIAEDHLDDARAWPRIFEASRDLTQPDGRRLSDPDLILPGWNLVLPGAEESQTDQTPQPRPEETKPPVKERAPEDSPGREEAADGAAARAEAEPDALTPTSNAPAVPSSSSQTGAAQRVQAATPAVDEAPPANAPWLLVGLSGAGAVLAGGLLAALRQRRRAQFRARRPGRTIAVPPPELIPVEKTITSQGAAALPTLTIIEEALKLLAASAGDAGALPDLVALQLLPGAVAVQLAEPGTLAAPWRADGEDGRRWLLATDDDRPQTGGRSPYPQVVSVGQDDTGATWLVNLEQLGTVSLTGDPTYAADFARYLAAEIAVNPWSRQVHLECVGIAPEAVALDPSRIHHHPLDDATALDAAIVAAGMTLEKCTDHGVPATDGRAEDLGGDLWDSWLVLVNGALTTAPLDHLLTVVSGHPARTGTAVVMVGDSEPVRGLGVRLTGHGRLLIPALGLDLVANGLTPAEAEGCARLLGYADELDDVEMPTDGDDGWREYCDAAGALRDGLVIPRAAEDESDSSASVIPGPDADVLDVAAATEGDLNQLAPQVPAAVRAKVEDSDPSLDADLAAWASGTRPHLKLLGPIQARTGTTGSPTVVAKRKAFYAELLAFLVLHPQGVTIDQVVDAFGTDATQMRVHLSKVRSWLGVDPSTGGQYLPDATKSPAGVARGMGIYQLVGVLADIDLFRRLRARGQARGPEGIADLQTALGLVTGEPFTGQRRGGWAWLADGIRVDQHMVCAVVDVAHLVTIAALHSGDLQAARAAAETALLAAPYEDTPQLDLAAIVAAEGDRQAAERILRDDVCNRAEDGEAPADLPDRTADLVASAPWLRKGRVA